ncbi:MAG: response regulator transcription factor [Gammaproteobacteria bacterium]|nr:response regulator transcription factor [Gammaproteobacteria bacterium]
MTQLLLIEDDMAMAGEIVGATRARGYQTAHVADGQAGLQTALAGQFDVIITDRMLPNLDGLNIVRALRAAGNATPVIVLSALDTVDDRVKGLRAGGDDYLGKPFAVEELLARLESLTRRQGQAALTSLQVEDLHLDLLGRKATRAGRTLDLTAREFRLLEFLARHAGQVVTRSMLLQSVWDIHYDPQTNVVDVHVSRLRHEVDRDAEKPLILTVRGVGYTLRG